MSNDVTLAGRGRGARNFPPDQLLLVSHRGEDQPSWYRPRRVSAGDFVGVAYGTTWATSAPVVPRPAERPLRGSEKRVLIPEVLTTDLALFLGAYFSEGHHNLSNWTVVITNSVEAVLKQVQAACHATFGLEGRIVRQPGKCPGFVVSSKRLVEFLTLLGCGSRASDKRVPEVIGESARELVVALLQGAALDAYTSCRGCPCGRSVSTQQQGSTGSRT